MGGYSKGCGYGGYNKNLSMRDNPLKVNKPVKVDKGWGYELQIVNNGKYCGKILHFNQNGLGSSHYHIDKYETWFIAKGCVEIFGVNPDSAMEYMIIGKEGDVIDVPRGIIHQVHATTDTDIFEISTPDSEEDNYRVEGGDSQK